MRLLDHTPNLDLAEAAANVLKIRPPMPFNSEDGSRLLETLASILEKQFPG